MIIVPKCAIFNGYALDFATLNPASNAIQGNVVWFGKLVSRHLGTGVSNHFFMLPLFIETTSLQITSSNFYSSSDPPLFKVQLNSRVVNTFSTNFYLENSRFILRNLSKAWKINFTRIIAKDTIPNFALIIEKFASFPIIKYQTRIHSLFVDSNC